MGQQQCRAVIALKHIMDKINSEHKYYTQLSVLDNKKMGIYLKW